MQKRKIVYVIADLDLYNCPSVFPLSFTTVLVHFFFHPLGGAHMLPFSVSI